MRTIIAVLFYTLLATAPAVAPAQIRLFAKGPDADQLYREAVRQVKLGHYPDALTAATAALKKEPQNIDYMLLTGRIYMLEGDLKPALHYMQQVLQKDPRYKEPYLLMANILIGLKQYDEAVGWLDRGLGQLHGDKDLALKKLGVLDAAGRYYPGNKLADSLVRNLPRDPAVKKAFTGHYMTAGYFYAKSGSVQPALESFRRVMAVMPADSEARQAIRNLYIRNGNYLSAMDEVNAQLVLDPDGYGLLMKKLGLLQQLHQYGDALDVLHRLTIKYPRDRKVKELQVSLRMDAARYYNSINPENLYKEVWDKDPGNMEALDKVIGLAMSREAYDDALTWIGAGLKRHPHDKKLLGQKMDILENQGRYGAAAGIAAELYRQHPSMPGIRERYVMLTGKSGRGYMMQQQYDLAQQAFADGLAVIPSDSASLQDMAAVLLLQKDSTGALKTLNRLMSFYPGDDRFVFRKAGLLAEMGRFDEALPLMRELAGRHAGSRKYAAALLYTDLWAGRRALHADELDEAAARLQDVLRLQPDNREALTDMVGLYYRTGRTDSALAYLDTALQYRPEDRDLQLKKVGLLAAVSRYGEADSLARTLMKRYPYTSKYKDAYLDAVRSTGRYYMQKGRQDSAMGSFDALLALSPSDSLSLLYAVNILSSRKSYDSALAYTAEALRYYPRNAVFLKKRATLFEDSKRYQEAAKVADTLVRLYPAGSNEDYADYLHAKTFKNQFGLFFLNSSYDYSSNHYKIATVEYRHFIPKGSYAFYLDYAARQEGTGLQGEGELYYKHGSKMYSYALVTYSNGKVFPRWRVAYSLFKSFPLDIEGELGARYLNSDSTHSLSGVASVSKTWDDFWMNLRAYFIREPAHFYTSYNYTLRFYTNPRKDYLSLVAALGTSPDDKSRLIEFPKLSGLLTRSVGVGYQKSFHYRTTVGLFGTWINQKISNTTFQNQYDIYISLQRLF